MFGSFSFLSHGWVASSKDRDPFFGARYTSELSPSDSIFHSLTSDVQQAPRIGELQGSAISKYYSIFFPFFGYHFPYITTYFPLLRLSFSLFDILFYHSCFLLLLLLFPRFITHIYQVQLPVLTPIQLLVFLFSHSFAPTNLLVFLFSLVSLLFSLLLLLLPCQY